MSFLEKYSTFISTLTEQDQPQDATTPAPAETPDNIPSSDTATSDQPQPVAPEGYVSMVKMLAKALVMDIPAGEIDAVFTGNNISSESAFDIQNKLKLVMNENEVKSDNIERLNNPNYKKFIESVSENNFMQKYNSLLSYMKSKSPNIN